MGASTSIVTSESDEESTTNSNGSFLLNERDRQNLLHQLENIAAQQPNTSGDSNTNSQPSTSSGVYRAPILNLVRTLQLSVRPPLRQAAFASQRRSISSMDEEDLETTSSDTGAPDNGNHDDGDEIEEESVRRRPRQRPILQAFCVPEIEPYKTSYQQLHSDIAQRCGLARSSQPMSVFSAMQKRELCSNWVNKHFISSNRARFGGFTEAEKVSLGAHFFPNRRRRVDSVLAKTFCIGYINGGNGGLMTASQDHKIRLYERYGPKQRYFMKRSLDVPYVGWSILDVVLSPDGRDLVYSTWNEAMYQCSIDDTEENWVPLRVDAAEARFALFSIRFNKDGTEIVAGSTDQHLYIYDRQTCCCVLTLKVHDDDVNAVCFGDDGSNILLSAADDGLVKVWDRRTMGEFGRALPVGVFAGHRDGITFIDSRGDDRYFLSNSKDQTIKLWDIRNFATEKGIESTRNSVRHQQWDYRWQCSPQENLRMSRIEGDCSCLTLRGHSVLHTLIRARFSPEHTGKRYIYTGCGRGNCVVYDMYSGEIKKIFGGHLSVVRDCCWSSEDNEIAIASWDGRTSLWTFDERYQRSTNPDGDEDEDSTDEQYSPIKTRNGKRRRRRTNHEDEDEDDVRKSRQTATQQ